MLTALVALSMAAPQEPLQPFTVSIPKSTVKVEMIPVPGGTLTIRGRVVEIRPYWIAKTEAPWELFDQFLASGAPSPAYDQTEFAADAIARPSKSYILPDLGWGHNGHPVINVSFTNVTMFTRWLATTTGRKFRLPTEAEWEWAARGASAEPWTLNAAGVDAQAWHLGNNPKRTTQPVGKKTPNSLGLFDMLGNVGEWATDLDGQPILCGPTFRDRATNVSPLVRRRWQPAWQKTDPQIPKSRWWLADAPFAGFRVVCEP